MVIQYKCPSCASDLSYDIEKDGMLCPHCQLMIPLDQLPQVDVPEGETADDMPDTPIDAAEVPDETDYTYQDDNTHEQQTFGAEAVELYEKYQPDILLSDIRMEGMDGITAAGMVLEKYPEARVLFLTTFSDDEYVVNALKCGAKGYILKQDFEGIVPALQAVYSGQSVFGGEIVNKLPSIQTTETKADKFAEKGITEK